MSCNQIVVTETDCRTVVINVPGPKGDTGNGVPDGGVAGDLLVKQSATNQDAEWQSTIDKLSFTPDIDPPLTLNQGETAWDIDDGTLDVGLNGGAVILQVGQETMYRVENVTGITIPNGTLCMYAGTVGNSGKIRVKPWDGTGTSKNILGLATADIANNDLGYVTTFGKVRGFQTNGANYGETWVEGDLIWARVGGGMTKFKPEAPATLARIGGVISAHSANGTMLVRVRLGSSLADDEKVYLVGQADGDALLWNEATERFEPGDVLTPAEGDAAYDPIGAAAAAYAEAVKRENHTGTQTLSTISDAGTAAAADLGTAPTEVPTNADLGSAAYVDIGTASGELIGTDEANTYYDLQYKPSVAPTLSSDFCANEHKRYEQYGLELKTILQQWSVARNSTATYFDANGVLQTAGINEPRIDYDPATGECRGLLVEGQGVNLLVSSEQFDNASWVKEQVTISANVIVAPDGSLTGDKLTENITNSQHRAYQVYSASATAYTFTAYLKAGERTWGMLYFPTISSTETYFNLATGAIGTIGTNISVASMRSVGKGWYRCSVTHTKTIAGNLFPAIQAAIANGAPTYTGDGTSGIYIWGAQLEQASSQSSYIKTEGSAVTRVADIITQTV